MSWTDRPYAQEPGGYGGRGVGSWLGGLPSAGRAVKGIMLANAGMFVLCLVAGGDRGALYQALEMNSTKVLHGQIWRLFTFTYLHDLSGLWHIGMNMLGLYLLGTPLERRWGARRFFAFYTLAGFAAVSLYMAMTVLGPLNASASLIGASGGVLGVLGACAVLFPQFRLIFFIFPVPIRTAAVFFVAMYSFNLWTRGYNAGGDACHLAGLAFGIAWGYRGHRWTRSWDNWRESMKRSAREEKRRTAVDQQAEVDRILDKVHREGIHSLSRHEKRTLETATKKQREEEQHWV